MSLSYFPGHALRTQSPQADFSQPSKPVQRTTPEACVGINQRREDRIAELGELVEAYMELAGLGDYFYWRGEADRARMARDAMVQGRTALEVAELEIKRGLS